MNTNTNAASVPGPEDQKFNAWYESKFKPAMERGPLDKYVARQAWFAALSTAAQPPGMVMVPVELVNLYEFMCTAFVPLSSQQNEIAISLKAAIDAMTECRSAAPKADKAEQHLPSGWTLTDHEEEVSLQSPQGERWRYRAASGAGTDSDFIHRFLRAMLAAKAEPQGKADTAPLNSADAEVKAEPVQQPERVPLIHQQIERAAQKLAEVMDYPWEPMPEQGRKTMRENALAVLEAAHGIQPAHKEQP